MMKSVLSCRCTEECNAFVHGYRECNTPVQVKGAALPSSVAFRHLILGII